MLHFIHANECDRHPMLIDSMFRDRATQFKTRLGWDVSVDTLGHERDAYDDHNPLYVIWSGPDGRHQGSLRLMPTMGRTMVNEHFGHLLHDSVLKCPATWECTRFCLAKDAPSGVSAALMIGGAEVMRQRGIAQYVGVFDARMVRIYQRIGWSPKVLARTGQGRYQISAGLWSIADADLLRMAAQAAITPSHTRAWYGHLENAPGHDLCATA